ncbi:hypothetical protein LTR66_016929, partial [Elasticomyces elasticus]
MNAAVKQASPKVQAIGPPSELALNISLTSNAADVLLCAGLTQDELDTITARFGEDRTVDLLYTIKEYILQKQEGTVLQPTTTRAKHVARILQAAITDPECLLTPQSMMAGYRIAWTFQIEVLCLVAMLHKARRALNRKLEAKLLLVIKCLRKNHAAWPRNEPPSPNQMRMILWCASMTELRNTILNYLKLYKNPHVKTILIFIKLCLYYDMHDFMVQIITRLPRELLANPPVELSQACALILRNDEVVQTDSGPNFKYLPALLEAGLNPDDLLYARIIQTALASDYSAVAWDLYYFLKQTKRRVEPRTYLFLLRHAFLNKNTT